MEKENWPGKADLLEALRLHNITVLADEGQAVSVIHDYRIEIEREALYKLWWRGEVVAPFNDLDELCQFILLG
ncbi:MAG: hypothetical protein H6555_02655 [Lewinellaceae bacterium]|nr:hypothetical protein [Lewinellaceae bacterium]